MEIVREDQIGSLLLPPELIQAWHAARAGLLNEGLAAASEALELARDLDLWLPRVQSLLVLTAITGRRGSEDQCLAYAEEVRPQLEEAGLVGYRTWLSHSLALLAIASSRQDDAIRELESVARNLDTFGIHSRQMAPRAQLAELHARAGEAEAAEQ